MSWCNTDRVGEGFPEKTGGVESTPKKDACERDPLSPLHLAQQANRFSKS